MSENTENGIPARVLRDELVVFLEEKLKTEIPLECLKTHEGYAIKFHIYHATEPNEKVTLWVVANRTSPVEREILERDGEWLEQKTKKTAL